jgi:hypothetical protein
MIGVILSIGRANRYLQGRRRAPVRSTEIPAAVPRVNESLRFARRLLLTFSYLFEEGNFLCIYFRRCHCNRLTQELGVIELANKYWMQIYAGKVKQNEINFTMLQANAAVSGCTNETDGEENAQLMQLRSKRSVITDGVAFRIASGLVDVHKDTIRCFGLFASRRRLQKGTLRPKIT